MRMRLPAMLVLVCICLAVPAEAPAPVFDKIDLNIPKEAAKWQAKVRELEERLDTLEGRFALWEGAARAGYVDHEGVKAHSDELVRLRPTIERLRKELSEARFKRDIFTAGLEDPGIVWQYLHVLELKRKLEKAIMKLYYWHPVLDGRLVIKREMPQAEWERLMQEGRQIQDEFNRENDKLGRMIKTYRDKRSGEGGGSGDGGGGGDGCFPAGVLVLMADGSYQPIETLRPGDMVLSMDLDAGETVVGRVAETMTQAEAFVFLINGELLTNGAHRFVTGHGPKAARDMEPGDVLLGRDGPTVVEAKERVVPRALASGGGDLPRVPVYNVLVEGTHTFYVSPDGEATYLVHDSCGCSNPGE